MGADVAIPIVMAVLALLLIGTGTFLLIRARKRGVASGGPLVLSWCLLGVGVCLGGFGGFVAWRPPLAFVQLFQTDYDSPERLEKLKATPVEALDRPAALGGAWPQWRGPRRDGVSDEAGLRTDWAQAPPPVVWKQPIGGGYSSVAVADGRLYTMDKQGNDERVLCLDAGTGKELWAHRYRVDYSALQGYTGGPRATPTVAGGRVFTVGATGVFLCLEAKPRDGRAHVLWQHNLAEKFGASPPGWGVACSPLVEGKLVCVQPGGAKGSVAAFDTRTGEVAWTALSEPSGYSSPVAATVAGVRQVICLTGKGLAGLRAADGKQLWYYRWPTEYDANIATPVLAGNYVFISSDYGAGCALLELDADGHGGVRAAPVYVKRNKLMRNHHASCVLYRGYLYGFDTSPDALKCVDLRTGREKWASRRPGKGSVLAADGALLVLTQEGSLALVAASPDGFRQQAELRDVLQGSDCWALPALADKRLYLRDQQHILCIDLKAGGGKKEISRKGAKGAKEERKEEKR